MSSNPFIPSPRHLPSAVSSSFLAWLKLNLATRLSKARRQGTGNGAASLCVCLQLPRVRLGEGNSPTGGLGWLLHSALLLSRNKRAESETETGNEKTRQQGVGKTRGER